MTTPVDTKDAEVYNKECESIGAQNFLEDYLMKVVNRWHAKNYILMQIL